MSALHRFLPLPASRRSYSFFSSRSGSGNGRYFSSPKQPPKSAVVATTTPASGKQLQDASKADLSKDQATAAVVGASTTATPTSVAVTTVSSARDSSSPKSTTSAPTSNPPTSSKSPSAPPTSSPNSSQSQQPPSTFALASAFAEITRSAERTSTHPTDFFPSHPIGVNSKDFKMHQFFALHRPLLLISEPESLFRGVEPGIPITGPPPPAPGAGVQLDAFGFPMAQNMVEPMAIDADAEAARQLTRALTMSQAGATIAWENTLRHLGLDPAKDEERVGLQERFEKEWSDVLMDSTKRKRRKKMKKHKLKKRRRATRSERLQKK